MIRFGLFLSYSGGARTAGGRGGVSTVGRSDVLYDCISELSISVRASRSSEPVSEGLGLDTFVYRHANMTSPTQTVWPVPCPHHLQRSV